ncbi:MAG: hypothetical protein GY825_14050, partial [Phycisphaeraceae bacterium]|nr:hypothetical protein [Phycisphaeraceae bacterium]
MDRIAPPHTYDDLCDAARREVRSIDAAELATLRSNGSKAVVVDVREPTEWQDGIVPEAILIPRGTLEKEIHPQVASPTETIYLYCATGKRSLLAAQTLQRMGFTDVCSIDGGFAGWTDAGLEIAPGPVSLAARDERAMVDHENWASIRSNFAISSRTVEVLDGSTRPLVYLDHAATTHPPDFAMEEVRNFLSLDYANVHRASYQLARRSTLR